MKIALVHDWLTGMRGGEKCLDVLCRRFPDARLFTLLRGSARLSPAIERMRITTSFLQKLPGIARHYRYCLPLMPRAIESLRLPDDLDLVVSLSHAVAKGIRPPRGVPHVCYCFTPMRYAWQLRDDYFGPTREGRRGTKSGPIGAARDALLDRVRRWDQQSSERVSEFVSISETIAQRIEECYGRTSQVIYPPVDTDFYVPTEGRREDFYLVASALVPYKKTELAIQACAKLGRRLVVLGSGPDRSRLERMAGPSVEFLGWRPDIELRDYLRRCRALLFPGHEDFGIVPVEAQACGAPVIAFARGGAVETVLKASEGRPGTGVFFDEQTGESLAGAMEWFERNPGLVSSRLARRQALRFAAGRYERELIDFLETTVERSRTRLVENTRRAA